MNNTETATAPLRGHGQSPTYRTPVAVGNRVVLTAGAYKGHEGIVTGSTWAGDLYVTLDNGTVTDEYAPSLNRI